ncbi:hypothetical protein MNBD_GAMMA21-2115 [hydrothermal vent metagenome]|uniref:Uncharacterized protein n=1 Tax=hydrothermal vent metagenome TaxID=652676 RepID=A0A3B1ABK3_9ZZZZ
MEKTSTFKLLLFCTYFICYLILPGLGVENLSAAPARPVNGGERCETEVAEADEDILVVKNQRYKLMSSAIYKCRKGKWVFDKTMKRAPVKHIDVRKTSRGCEVHNTKTGQKKIDGVSNFASGFEVPSFLGLFKNEGWSIVTVLSPKADSVKKYMKLNRKIMSGGKFLDNRLDLEEKNIHSGKKSLRLFAVKPSFLMVTSKSLIEKKGLCFGKGDHIWFSGWYYFKKGMPSTIVDIEDRLLISGPGIRLFIRNKKYASMELKFAHKPQFNQKKVEIPRQQWVHIRLHLVLSNHEDGVIEMWQDDKKILSTTGQTLPMNGSVYNALQIGITATSMKTELLVDDVMISDKPLW